MSVPGRLAGITETCPGEVEQNRSLSWGYLQICPDGDGVIIVSVYCPGGGGGRLLVYTIK